MSANEELNQQPLFQGLFGRAVLLLLGALVLMSALAVVYVKFQSRVLFADLQALQADADRMNIEWGQLQLEQSTKLAHGEVEHLARQRLAMIMPSSEQVVVIRP